MVGHRKSIMAFADDIFFDEDMGLRNARGKKGVHHSAMAKCAKKRMCRENKNFCEDED